MPAAVEMMLEKAEGAFVYIARAFDDLDGRPQAVPGVENAWTLEQLKRMLPKVVTRFEGLKLGGRRAGLDTDGERPPPHTHTPHTHAPTHLPARVWPEPSAAILTRCGTAWTRRTAAASPARRG